MQETLAFEDSLGRVVADQQAFSVDWRVSPFVTLVAFEWERGGCALRVVERVELKGRGRLLLSIEMVEKDGDSTMTRIVKMDPDRPLAAAQLDRMFAE